MSKQQPATLNGTIMKIEPMTSKGGKQYQRITLALYNGKDKDGSYKPSTYVSVAYFGDVAFNVKDRATFAGNLEAMERTVGEKTCFNLNIISFEAIVEAHHVVDAATELSINHE